MKKLNKILIVSLLLLSILAASITAFAFTERTPYCQITDEYSDADREKFREEMLENKKAILNKRVDDGILSREEADEILQNIEEMQEYCIENGGGFGMMRNSFGNSNGFGTGNGTGNGGNRCMKGFGANRQGRGF